MPARSKRREIDRLLDGRLHETVTGLRSNAASWDQIAEQLSTTGVKVNGETVRRWCQNGGDDG